MSRRYAFLCLSCLLIVSLGATGLAQSAAAQTEVAPSPVVITAVSGTAIAVTAVENSAGLAMTAIPPIRGYPYVLVLSLQDNGGTFTIPVNGLIILQIPRLPFSDLIYDPTILRPALIRPLPPQPPIMPNDNQPELQPTPNGDGPDLQVTTISELTPTPGVVVSASSGAGTAAAADSSQMTPGTPVTVPNIEGTPINSDLLPANQWRLVAIRPGVTGLSIQSRPCTTPPCPMGPSMPTYQFAVTIIVQGIGYPPPTVQPPYPPYTGRTDVYIGTAYLNQVVTVRPGQIVAVDLPSLAPQQTVRLAYDSSILQPLNGQDLTHPQPGGWRFQVTATGTTTLIVSGPPCTTQSTDCAPPTYFQVTIHSTNLNGQ